MRRIIKFIIFVLVLFAGYLCLGNISASAKGDLDRINSYVITVDPNFNDGSLDIRIDIKWKVLDSDSEGPLTWVKIGVPNFHVENITPLTSNIKKAKYMSDDGSFIKIDFDRKYYTNEVVDFSFSFNQSYMYHLVGDLVYYDYNPGYFHDILVDKCILKWKADEVINIRETTLQYKIIDGYYVYESSLSYSEYIKIHLNYHDSAFTAPLDKEKTYTDASEPYPWLMPTIILSAIVIVVIIMLIVSKLTKDPYKSERGFYGESYWFYHFMPWRRSYYHNGGVTKEGKPINPPTSVGGGHHSGGGCACACACAGGGRAGCSMKDFYHTNLDGDKVINVVKEQNKNDNK